MFHDQSSFTLTKSLDRTMTPTKAECIAKLKAARQRLNGAAVPKPPVPARMPALARLLKKPVKPVEELL